MSAEFTRPTAKKGAQFVLTISVCPNLSDKIVYVPVFPFSSVVVTSTRFLSSFFALAPRQAYE